MPLPAGWVLIRDVEASDEPLLDSQPARVKLQLGVSFKYFRDLHLALAHQCIIAQWPLRIALWPSRCVVQIVRIAVKAAKCSEAHDATMAISR